jgi:misacylated tRNA(Ala) deacylase
MAVPGNKTPAAPPPESAEAELFATDAYRRDFDSSVLDVDREQGRVALGRTVFYPGGGGQPHDLGTLRWDGGTAAVTKVKRDGGRIWHWLDTPELPDTGSDVFGELDWDRRLLLMRTHTALHILCGVIWNEWGTAVTGGNMEPLKARMDFEFDPLPEGFGPRVEDLVNQAISQDHPIEVSFLPRGEAVQDADLIRTKVNLIPEWVTEIRVVDIVGLDKQADGGTHVASTTEVGKVRVVKTESKGKGNKRIRIEVVDG